VGVHFQSDTPPTRCVPAPLPPAGVGTVKAVLSGDTVVIVGNAKPGAAAPEIQLSLSHLKAPRLARGKEQKDEVRAAAGEGT